MTTRIGTVGADSPEARNRAGRRSGQATTGRRSSRRPCRPKHARLLTATPALYPPAARTAEVEADVPVEIVVGREGRVESATAIGPASGFGLERAAETTVRGYRFTAATKDGAPVRVRMRWVVQFRLR
ncbi:MAG: energy transducer TonB [Polyangiaceae bacterium]